METKLPQEVAIIAENVSVEKRNEVQTVLNHVFNGVSKMREQLENISVKDQNDEISMKLAGTVRLAVKRERLDAEKKFDAKRAEVQQEMLGFKTLDSLYLKAKQIMQIQTKELEEIALFKEETKKRFESEQKELKIQTREIRLGKYMFAPDINRKDFENMSDESFELFFAGIEKAHNDRIEAEKKAEAERIAKEKAEAEERERIRKENEQLKAEADRKEKELAAERAKAEAEKKAIEDKARKEKEEADKKLKAEQQKAREAADKAAAEKAKLEAAIKAKADAEFKAQKEKEAKELADAKAKAESERKAKNAPEKTKLLSFAEKLKGIERPEIQSEDATKIMQNVDVLIDKIVNYITENASKL